MPYFVEIQIGDGPLVDVVFLDRCAYILADGSRLDVSQQEAFCRNCRKAVIAEAVPSVSEIEARVRDLQDPAGRFRAAFDAVLIDGFLHEEIARHKWRQLRQSPPRCLSCGQTDILAIDADEVYDTVLSVHIKRRSTGHTSCTNTSERLLTSEGLRTDSPPMQSADTRVDSRHSPPSLRPFLRGDRGVSRLE